MDIKIIDISVNIDHVHLFIQYPPKYSVSFIAKKIKGRSSRILRQHFPHLREWLRIIFGRQGVITGRLDRDGKQLRNIFQLKTVQLRINNNLYMRKNVNKPRILQVRGIVTSIMAIQRIIFDSMNSGSLRRGKTKIIRI